MVKAPHDTTNDSPNPDWGKQKRETKNPSAIGAIQFNLDGTITVPIETSVRRQI